MLVQAEYRFGKNLNNPSLIRIIICICLIDGCHFAFIVRGSLTRVFKN